MCNCSVILQAILSTSNRGHVLILVQIFLNRFKYFRLQRSQTFGRSTKLYKSIVLPEGNGLCPLRFCKQSVASWDIGTQFIRFYHIYFVVVLLVRFSLTPETVTWSRNSCKATCTRSSCRRSTCRRTTSKSSSTRSSEVSTYLHDLDISCRDVQLL